MSKTNKICEQSASNAPTRPCDDCMCPQTCAMFERCMLTPINDHAVNAQDIREAATTH